MPTFGMKSYECGPWRDSWGTMGLLSFPCRGRPGDKIIVDSQKWHKPVFADIPYWISASFQVRPWLFLMWAFRLLILALLDPHTGQQNGFSPVCILMCIISFCFEMNFLLHWSHWCSQDSCLRKYVMNGVKRAFLNFLKIANVDEIHHKTRYLPQMCLLTEVESTAQAMLLSTSATAPALPPRVQGLAWKFQPSKNCFLVHHLPGGRARCLCASLRSRTLAPSMWTCWAAGGRTCQKLILD